MYKITTDDTKPKDEAPSGNYMRDRLSARLEKVRREKLLKASKAEVPTVDADGYVIGGKYE